MRYCTIAVILVLAALLAVSCKTKKDIPLEDYARIELEVNLPDPELDRAKVEAVVKKYGYSYDQYKEMFDRVERDPKLKEQLGEIRLHDQKPE